MQLKGLAIILAADDYVSRSRSPVNSVIRRFFVRFDHEIEVFFSVSFLEGGWKT